MDNDQTENSETGAKTVTNRRSVLRLGAVAVPAVVTLSPGMAMATGGYNGGGGGGGAAGGGQMLSVMACTVEMPRKIDADGIVVTEQDYVANATERQARNYNNGRHPGQSYGEPTHPYVVRGNKAIRVFEGPPAGFEYPEGNYQAEQLRVAYETQSVPYQIQADQFEAHKKYFQNLRASGNSGSGLTCLMSIEMSTSV